MVSNKRTRNRKKFLFHVDRKHIAMRSKKLPRIKNTTIKENWRSHLSTSKNLKVMGLAYDVNKALPISTNTKTEPTRVNKAVVKELEKEANAPRNGTMRMPQAKVKWIEYLLEKYGEDYEAMVFDKNNHYQETAAQLRQKIKQYKKRPAYMVKFLKSKEKLGKKVKADATSNQADEACAENDETCVE